MKGATVLIRLAIFPALISLFVLFGWVFHWPGFVRFSVSDPPMVFNTAVCVLVLCLSYLSISIRSWRRFRNVWILVTGLGLLSVLQSLFQFDLNIDRAFLSDSVDPTWTGSFKMPIVSAFCLLFSSLAWGALLYRRYSRILFLFFAFASSCAVLCLAILAMMNAAILIPLHSGWQSFSHIPFHSGFCFAIFGWIGLNRSIHHLSTQETSQNQIYGILSGLVAFFLTVLFWQICLQRNTEQISRSLDQEIRTRSEKLTHSLFKQVDEFHKMQLPENSKMARQSQWQPPFPAKAVIRLAPRLEVLWQPTEHPLDRDLALLLEQLTDLSHLRFHPSFYFQRARWFAFSDHDRLLILSPEQWLQSHFPKEYFSYSLLWKGQVLTSNLTSSKNQLMQWQKDHSLVLWDTDLILQVTPTQDLYNRLDSLHPLLFLIAGVVFSLLTGIGFVGLLYVKRRFSR